MLYYDDENCTDENFETDDFIKIGSVFNFEKYPQKTFSAKVCFDTKYSQDEFGL